MVFFYTLSMQEKALVVENLELWLRKKSRSCADTTLELFGATLMLAWWGKLYMQAFITAIPLMPTLNTSTVLKELTAGASTSEALRTVTTCMTIQRAFITRLTFNGFTSRHLAPIYERLTDFSLLARCKQHLTQNANESFHHTVWTRCSKLKKPHPPPSEFCLDNILDGVQLWPPRTV